MTTLVTARDLSRHLDLSRQRIAVLAADGVLKRFADGRFDQDAARLAYFAWLRGVRPATATATAAGRVHDARAREIEARIVDRERGLIATDRAIEIVKDIIGIYRGHYGTLPGRGGWDPDLRRVIEVVCDAVQRTVDVEFRKRTAALIGEGGE